MPQRDPFTEIEQLVERMGRPFESGGLSQSSVPVDLGDEGDAFVLVADLPGYDRDDISVTVDERTVSLTAERDERIDVEERDYVHRERSHSERRRRVRLPSAVDESEASASYQNGVLTVRLPKRGGGEDGHSIDVE